MKRELVFLPEVSRDLIEGFNYYETFSPGHGGERFETAFKQAILQVEDSIITHFQPFQYFHRICVAGYPYNIYYRLVEDRAVITALLYSRFDPKKIRETLARRG